MNSPRELRTAPDCPAKKTGWFTCGAILSETVGGILSTYSDGQEAKRHHSVTTTLVVQAVVGMIAMSIAY